MTVLLSGLLIKSYKSRISKRMNCERSRRATRALLNKYVDDCEQQARLGAQSHNAEVDKYLEGNASGEQICLLVK